MTPFKLTLREARMIVDRILLQTQVPAGSIPTVRDTILYAEAAGLPALKHLHDRIEELKAMNLRRLLLLGAEAGELALDAQGEHAFGVAPALLDLAVAEARRHGKAVIRVTNLGAPEFLAGLPAYAWRWQCDVEVKTDAAGQIYIAARDRRPKDAGAARPDSAEDPVMRELLHGGFPVTREAWREIYDLSQGALTPDTVSSRRHAGTVMVDAEGRVIGRPDDDDTDFSFLTQKQPPSNETHAA